MTAPAGAYAPTQLPAEARGRLRDTFFVQLDFPNVPVGLVATPGAFAVDSDADFIITGGAARTTTVADRTVALPDPTVLVQLTRSGAGRSLQNNPVPLSNLLGTAQRPARWEAPMLLRANSNLAVILTSAHGVVLFVQITFWGYKIFNTQA